jgi:uncharacterized protein (TIGR03032 family)
MDAAEERFERHANEWRDPVAVAAQWSEAGQAEPGIFTMAARGEFWSVIEQLGITLVVSREYEHLLLALSSRAGRPHVTFLRLPHPSGITFDTGRKVLFAASTRNPNQLYEFEPAVGMLKRSDDQPADVADCPLVPVRTRYLPGCSYIHDLAMIGGELYANSVGQNVVLRLGERAMSAAWWPRSIDRSEGPDTQRNYIQLNSIAAGDTVETSYFSASGEMPGAFVPGDADYPVDGRGVIFAGATREVMMRGLTRPHSARIHDGRVWVDNSGYGQLAVSDGADGYEIVTRLPGWTRGLTFAGHIAFVGTSRVIPRFRQYAPGLDVDASSCAIHAIDTRTGDVLGSLDFPTGNQIFAIESFPESWSRGFPFLVDERDRVAERRLFYAYTI